MRDLIFWTDVGEVGFNDYQKRLKRKQIALQMSTDLHDDVSPDKALQMISKAIEAQEKHDKAFKRRRADFTKRNNNKNNNRSGQQRNTPRRKGQTNNSNRQSSARTTSRDSSSKSTRKSSSNYRGRG